MGKKLNEILEKVGYEVIREEVNSNKENLELVVVGSRDVDNKRRKNKVGWAQITEEEWIWKILIWILKEVGFGFS